MTAEQLTTLKPTTLARRLTRLLDGPLLFVGLSATTVALTVKFALLYTALHAALAAPAIQGWNWGNHPNTLLIAYKATTCGCGAHLSYAISQGIKHHADVVVVASAADARDASLAPVRADRRVQILTSASSQTLFRLLPKGGTAILNVQHGRITHRITGSVLPDDFFH